jgi:hypothetical protein
MRPRGVPSCQNEPVAARRERRDQVAQHAAQSRKTLKRAELEEFVEQERRGRVVDAARRVDERKRRVEGVASTSFAWLRRTVRMREEWRRLADRL